RSDHRHMTPYQIGYEFGQSVILVLCPMVLDSCIFSFNVAAFADALPECRHEVRPVGRRRGAEKSDHRHPRLLPACRKRPRRCRTAEQRDELTPGVHSMTSSARARTEGGTVRPNNFAIFKLMTI